MHHVMQSNVAGRAGTHRIVCVLLAIVMSLSYSFNFTSVSRAFAYEDTLDVPQLGEVISPDVAYDEQGKSDVIVHFATPEIDPDAYASALHSLHSKGLLGVSDCFGPFDGTSLDQAFASDSDTLSAPDALSERARVIAKLQIHALFAQHEVRQILLESQLVSYSSYWITNSMQLSAPKESIERIARLPLVDSITPNREVHYDDSIQAKKRGKRAVPGLDEQKEIEPNLKAIRADKVWEEFGITGAGVLVGLVDQGVDISHPALMEHYAGYNAQDQTLDINANSFDALNDGRSMQEGHGTHVAGILVGSQTLNVDTPASADDASAGVSGASSSFVNRTGVAPGARFVNARAFREGVGATNEDVIAACQWMMAPLGNIDRAPRIVNHSWTDGTNHVDPWFDEMARSMRAAGMFNVMSAGNNGATKAAAGSIDNPASSPLLFSVGAVTNEGTLTSFSRRGPSSIPGADIKPDVVAPGYQIRSTLAGGAYAAWNGTSMAAPHVAGVAALMLEANPNLSVDEMESILRQTARPLTDGEYADTPNQGYGYGMVDAYAAVSQALERAGKTPARSHATLSGQVMTARVARADLSEQLGNATLRIPKTAFVNRAIPVSLWIEQPQNMYACSLHLCTAEGARIEGVEPVGLTQRLDQSRVYEGSIPLEHASGQQMYVRAHITTSDGSAFESSLISVNLIESVKPGAFSSHLETLLPGFATSGDFKHAEANLQFDPTPPSATQLIGLNPGSAHMGNDATSTIQFPRIDLTADELQAEGIKPELVYMEYADWSRGVLGMQLEVYPTKENKAVFNYDTNYKTDGWVERRVDLSPFKGMVVEPFIFNLNNDNLADGHGLYIDDVSVELSGGSDNLSVGADSIVLEDQQITTFSAADESSDTQSGVVAHLSLEGSGYTVVSHAPDGAYRFDKVPAGEYQLLISSPGFSPKRIPVSITVDDVHLDVELEATDAAQPNTDAGTNDLEAGVGGDGLTEYALDHNNPLSGALFTSRVMDGAAIALDPLYDGVLDHLAIYVEGNNPASKSGAAQIAVKKINTAGRLIDVMPPQSIHLERGCWNIVNLVDQKIALTKDERVYVIVQSLVAKGEGPAVGIDGSVRPGTNQYAKGYYYNGEFTSLKARGYFGVPMIRVYAADTSDHAATDPTQPVFDTAIQTNPVLDIISEEGQEPKDLIQIGDWTISPSRGMISAYNALDDLMSKDPSERVLEIPAEIGGVRITSIGADAFSISSGRGDVARVVIPEGVTEINESAFQFLGMRELVLPKSLERIYGFAFQGSRITELDIPDGVTYIGDSAFEGSNSLKELVVPDSVAELGRACFKGASSLAKLVLPHNPAFTDIPAGGFANTFALTEVEIPASVTRIKASAFDSSSLETVIFHEGLKYIDDSAFAGTETLRAIELPDSVVEIGSDAFNNGKLTGIRLPASLEKIGDGAFKKNQITRVIFGNALKFVDWDAFAHNPLELVRLNETIMPREGYSKKLGLDGEALGSSVKVLEVYSMDQVSADLKKNIIQWGDPQTDIQLISADAKNLITLTSEDATVAVRAEAKNLNGATKLVFVPYSDEETDASSEERVVDDISHSLITRASASDTEDSSGVYGSLVTRAISLELSSVSATIRALQPSETHDVAAVHSGARDSSHLRALSTTPPAQVLKLGELKLYNDAGESVEPVGPIQLAVRAPEGFRDHPATGKLEAGMLDMLYRVGDEPWVHSGSALSDGIFTMNATRLPVIALVHTPLTADESIDPATIRYGWLPADPFAHIPADNADEESNEATDESTPERGVEPNRTDTEADSDHMNVPDADTTPEHTPEVSTDDDHTDTPSQPSDTQPDESQPADPNRTVTDPSETTPEQIDEGDDPAPTLRSSIVNTVPHEEDMRPVDTSKTVDTIEVPDTSDGIDVRGILALVVVSMLGVWVSRMRRRTR